MVQSLDSAHLVLFHVFLPCHGRRLCGIPLASGTSGSQLEYHHGKSGEPTGSVCCKICSRSKTGSVDTWICILIVHILRQNIRPSPRMAAHRTAIFSFTRRSGRSRSHRRPTRSVHAHPQLRRPGIPSPDWRHFRHPCQLQRLRPVLALLPDAGRHERQ